MTDPELVKDAFKGYLTISDELSAELAKISEVCSFSKNEKIYTRGTVVDSVGIVREGLVRSFIPDADKKEMTIWFGEVGDFITSFYSFFTGKEGLETIDCIEDTSVLMIPVAKIKALMKENREMLFLYSVILEKSYMYWEDRYTVNQIYESEERYAHFYNRGKSTILKIPLKILSSYLNIRQETLSRIRKRWLKQDHSM